jgi:3-phenylpropionate/trans-cinnamate dioxygenase ferredoxin reductase subunit
MRSVAVVGASLAGLSAARNLRGLGFDGRVTIIGTERHRPYDRPPLSKDFLLDHSTVDDLALGTPDDDALDLNWRLGCSATRLDPWSRTVSLSCGEDVRVDGVVLAAGANARTVPGADDLSGVHTLRTVDDALALRESLRRGGPLVVIGAGFIGAEVAASARSMGLDVTIIEARPTPMAAILGSEMGSL